MKNLRLKAARAGKDLSQQALAELVGVSRQTINAIEKATTIQPFVCALPFAKHWTKLWTIYFGRYDL